jgi:hypothetical protein
MQHKIRAAKTCTATLSEGEEEFRSEECSTYSLLLREPYIDWKDNDYS